MRYLRSGVLVALGLLALFIGLFVGYGWSPGHDPLRALGNLLAPHPNPVERNPALPAVAKDILRLSDVVHDVGWPYGRRRVGVGSHL